MQKKLRWRRSFYKNIRDLPNVKIYGDPEMALHAPIISLNIGDEDSARIADILWEDYSICVRAGAHCAPLMHKALGTVEQGVVRFSFSHFNTEAEVLADRSRCSGACTGDLICASKKTYIVLSFRTTLDAMEWEKQCLAEKGSGQAHPTAARDLRRLRPCLADAAGRI